MSSTITIPTYSLLVLILISIYFALANADALCDDVNSNLLIPCQGFLMSGNDSPNTACCSGAQIIDKQFHESGCSDREAICLCLKNAAQTLPIDLQKAAKFPALCNLDYISIDPNVDCSKD
nr:non-specific lipid-transfer protein-like [Solanum lycopersicum]